MEKVPGCAFPKFYNRPYNQIYTILDLFPDSLSNSKRTKDIKPSPKNQSNVANDEAVYELPDSECTETNQAEEEISAVQDLHVFERQQRT